MSMQQGMAAPAMGSDFIMATERALAAGNVDLVSDADLQRVLTAAVKLYAAKSESAAQELPPVNAESVTPTDVVVTVSAMIRAAGLNLFDLSMWFNRPR
jgi:hypothetical protein